MTDRALFVTSMLTATVVAGCQNVGAFRDDGLSFDKLYETGHQLSGSNVRVSGTIVFFAHKLSTFHALDDSSGECVAVVFEKSKTRRKIEASGAAVAVSG